MEGLELIAFNIISSVGTARSSYIEAIQKAKEGDFEAAEALIKEGDEVFVEGHNAHAGLLQQEAEGGPGSTLSLLILHAEDQLMSAEGFKTIAQEFIEVYKKFKELGKENLKGCEKQASPERGGFRKTLENSEQRRLKYEFF